MAIVLKFLCQSLFTQVVNTGLEALSMIEVAASVELFHNNLENAAKHS